MKYVPMCICLVAAAAGCWFDLPQWGWFLAAAAWFAPLGLV